MIGLIDTSVLTAIADAIRGKLGVQTTYKPSEMPEAIESISGGGITPTGTKQVSITQNGVTTEDVIAYANAEISVNVVNQDYVGALVALGVTEDLTDSIEALTTYANGVTGESDTTLSDAVASLADGYGQGGGSFYSGTYTPEQDTAGPSFDVGAANISHFLIYATTDPRESEKKWFIYAHTDFTMNIVGFGSNNSGISTAGGVYENSWFTKKRNGSNLCFRRKWSNDPRIF